jgi:hypothetical protein
MAQENPNKSDKVVEAEHMVDELLQSMPATHVSKGSGINYITISKIAKGDSSRISERVFASIKKFYDARQTGEVEVTSRPRKKRAAKAAPETAAPAPSTFEDGDLVSIGTIQSEILKTEKRLSILKKMLELAKEL